MTKEEEDFEDFQLAYSVDNAILMHRDIHFGGSFDLMLEYYGGEGKGISDEFDLARIQELNVLEKQTKQNLAANLLSGAEAETVAKGREAYKKLRALYDAKSSKNPIPYLIADLILSEGEDEIESAIQAVVEKKGEVVPALIDLLRNEDFYSPLYPGYGFAPILAAECLGRIGDKRAIISLFEAVGEGDFFNEDILLNALHAIGEPARDFLLKVLHGRPITIDNEKAAIALVRFKEDPMVSRACFDMLRSIDLNKEYALGTYLILACDALPEKEFGEFANMLSDPKLPKPLRRDIEMVIRNRADDAK